MLKDWSPQMLLHEPNYGIEGETVAITSLWLTRATCSPDLFYLFPGIRTEIGFPGSFAVKCGHRTEFYMGNTGITMWALLGLPHKNSWMPDSVLFSPDSAEPGKRGDHVSQIVESQDGRIRGPWITPRQASSPQEAEARNKHPLCQGLESVRTKRLSLSSHLSVDT